jgi:hypothetical protein
MCSGRSDITDAAISHREVAGWPHLVQMRGAKLLYLDLGNIGVFNNVSC